jgi:hypothetical protein
MRRENLPLNALRWIEAAARLGRQNAASEEMRGDAWRDQPSDR